VIELYTAIVINKTPAAKKPAPSPRVSNLLDMMSAEPRKPEAPSGTLTELNDIFSSPAPPPEVSAQILLSPHVVSQASDSSLDGIMAMINSHKKPSPHDLLGNFDLPAAPSPSKSPQKAAPRVPLAEIDSIVTGMKSKLLEGPDDAEASAKPASDSDDDHSLISEDAPTEKIVEVLEVKQPEKIALKDIKVDISEIAPSETEAPRTIMDEKKGLKILVNFTNDRPARDVMVLVITVTNQGPSAISNFQFDASVSKPCKVRVLEASGHELPGVRPFKPPTETINQVLLLMNPTQKPVNMIAILTYISQDDEDPYKESFEVKDIPFS